MEMYSTNIHYDLNNAQKSVGFKDKVDILSVSQSIM